MTGVATLDRPEALLVALPLWLLTTYGTARTLYSRSAHRRRRALAELADRLAAIVEEEIGRVRKLAGAS